MLTVLGLISLFLPVIYVLSDGFREKGGTDKALEEVQARIAQKESEKALDVINRRRDSPLTVGGLVTVVDAPATRDVGAAGQMATLLRAVTRTPEGVDVIGTQFMDAAVYVSVPEMGTYLWLYPDLVSSA